MNEVDIWTDGACSKRLGGWAFVIKMGKHRKEDSGAVEDTTNNRMEMQAAIEALSALKSSCKVDLHTDSELIVNAFNQNWLMSWQNRDWETRDGGAVKNQDLWEALAEQDERHDMTWTWVKGHGDDVENNRCDELAVQARLSLKDEHFTLKDKIHKALGALKQARTRAHAAFKLIEELKDNTEIIEFDLFASSKKDLAKLIKQTEAQLVEELENGTSAGKTSSV